MRIYPGLITVCLVCVFLLGPLLTTLPRKVYWQHQQTFNYLYNASAWVIEYPLPAVFADNPRPYAVNGSLWSLPYEVTCYIVLAVLSFLPGTSRVKLTCGAAILALMVLARPPESAIGPFSLYLGMDYYHGKMGLLFALGSVVASWRIQIRPLLRPAILLLVIALLLPHGGWQLLLYVLGMGTLTLWLALYGTWLPRVPTRMGDWSYGAYLYGFPVQQVLAHFKWHEISFVGYVVACTVITFALAGLSWHLVEKQALRWK